MLPDRAPRVLPPYSSVWESQRWRQFLATLNGSCTPAEYRLESAALANTYKPEPVHIDSYVGILG